MDSYKTYKEDFTIRLADRSDAALIVHYIRELAKFEGELHEVTATKETLETYMFDKGGAEALIGEFENQPVGFAFFHMTFSTFLGKPGIALVDLYIEPEMRNRGYGATMLKRLAQITKERDCERLEWWVHDWNHDAVRFYKSYGAEMVKEIRIYRLASNSLDAFTEG